MMILSFLSVNSVQKAFVLKQTNAFSYLLMALLLNELSILRQI